MKDSYGRKIEYLRLSVTDLCNLRCIYCMEKDGVDKKQHSEILSIEDLNEIARTAYGVGIKKIRLTGGEPLVRKGIIDLCSGIRAISDEIEIGITTNGTLLKDMAEDLKSAGADRLNISLDTLNADTYKQITRTGSLQDVLDGIEAARLAGFETIKINTVLIGGVNDADVMDMIHLTKDHDLHVRFIELMPMGVTKDWDDSRFITVEFIEQLLHGAELIKVDGVARVYRFPDHCGTVGLISPMSNSFCAFCNKIRVTADGKLKPCLHSEDEIDLKGLRGKDLSLAIQKGILNKPLQHHLCTVGTDTKRSMNEIGG